MSDLSLTEQEAMEAVIAWPISRAPVQDAFQAGWLAARDFYGQQLRDLESEIVREHIGEQRLRQLVDGLLTARADIIGINAAGFDSTRGEVALRAIKRIDAALAASPETEAHDA
jgi:hypothetical protein